MANRVPRLLIDPGHYAGYNKGAAPGYFEGDRMWKLSVYQQEALRNRGIIADLTKSSCAQDIGVVTRGRMAKGYTAIISNHSNACADPSVDRPVGIYFTDDNCGPIDEESKELAKVLSDTVAQVMGTRYKPEIYSRKSSNDRDNDGKINDDYYGLLYGAHQVGVPGIILEHSFHTCSESAKWLMDDDNLRRLAEAEADAIAEYYGVGNGASSAAPTKKEEKDMLNPVLPGDKGEDVKQLQRLLRVLGRYGGDIDGSYGPATKEAVKAFQKSVGLDDDGIAGEKTMEALARTQLFEDVPNNAWYAEKVTEAVALGLTEGVGGGKLEPERAMTRAEAFALAVRVAKM